MRSRLSIAPSGAPLLTALALVLAAPTPAQSKYTLHEFKKHKLSSEFFCEGATFGDIDGDGNADAISGPYWYAGPEFVVKHEIYPPKPFDTAVYSTNFFAFVYDFNADGANDILFIGFPGQDASWFENPKGAPGHWKRHVVFKVVDNESPTFQDVTGDGKPELICQTGDRLGWAAPDWNDPTKPWVFHAISPKGIGGRFTHGLGIGDINGDGRLDILSRQGWWRQPESLEGDPRWYHFPAKFAGRGGAQMYAYDVDGDGDNDVISSWNAHGYGLSWFEHVRKDGKIAFLKHQIMGEEPTENPYGLVIGNLHAVDLVDMDGDGLKDIVTGSRYWAHGGRDKADRAPALIYWFKLVRPAEGQAVQFVPHEIDADSGVGTQVVAGDMNGDDLPDVVVGNKMGTFVHLHEARGVSRSAYYEARRKAITKIRSAVRKKVDRSGTAPKGKGGKKLNLDFETGDLQDWSATGNAFVGIPIEGDTVEQRRSGSRSQHVGKYWVGTYEVERSDKSKGTLTSASFPVTQAFASFLVGGGRSKNTRVELVRADSGEVFYKTSGANRENMTARFVDLSEHKDHEIFIRLVDDVSGGWGHINFDDFVFHDRDPRSAEEIAEEPTEQYGLPPAEAAANMAVADGFRVELVRGEPDLLQPIAMCMDDKARLWVAEAHSYPVRKEEGEGADKILVFSDSDGDGSYDQRTVFADDLNLVSGLEVGFGGVWVGASPYFMFIPDRDGDLVPDGEPEILLDGWGREDTHETLNAFNWGPDGWLYGCHGVFTHSKVGKPGTPDEDREKINAGVWRYHPTEHEFEVFAWGSSNPWGVDFDDRGQCFITACVIPHLYHVIQGGRYHRQSGKHFNPHVYEDIKTIADHLHYLGAKPHAGNGVSGIVGGGHAHCGAMVYLGDSFPDRYRNAVFMSNIHGHRVNVDLLAREGSGFSASHGDDFLLARDEWYMGINLRYGPDGNVYLIDWYDEQSCHDKDPETWDRSNGRLYKISYGEPQPASVDLAAKTDEELVALQLHRNDWYVRVARRLLQERGGNPGVHAALGEILARNPDQSRKLRALWALHVTGGLTEELALAQLTTPEEYVRAWTIQLSVEDHEVSAEMLAALTAMAASDPSPVVRLYLASALARLTPAEGWPIAERLVAWGEDQDDHNLPLMIWYGVEPMVMGDPARALRLAESSAIPLIKRHVLRRLASGGAAGLTALLGLMERTTEEDQLGAILDAMTIGLKKAGDVPMPDGWPATAKRLMGHDSLRDRTASLAVTFGDLTIAPYLRGLVGDAGQTHSRRTSAISDLVRLKDAELPPMLHRLLDDPELRLHAIRSLASFDDAETPGLIIARFADLDEPTRVAAVATLTGRASHACALLTAIDEQRVPGSVLESATARRQIASLDDEAVNELMMRVWGRSEPTSKDKQEAIDRYKDLLTDKFLDTADLPHGRALFSTTCAVCHKLFGRGIDLGPDITGSNRADLDYILGNVVDPSSDVGKQYMMSVVTLKDGRVVSGMITDENEQTLTVKNQLSTEVIKRSDIATKDGAPDIARLETSLMPEGQMAAFSDEDVRDLIAYLGSETQVPLPATTSNVADFFNGTDLTGWNADPEVWSVEDGQLVGKSAKGLAKNDFAKSELLLDDFRMVLQVRLVGNRGNSGIQFRSEVIDGGDVKGYQADIGVGWWGKLYEEHGRGKLWDKSGDSHVRQDEWNTYEILAIGGHIRTALNGQLCVDLKDEKGAEEGIIALQVHSGGPTEVRFKDFRIELDPDPVMKTVR